MDRLRIQGGQKLNGTITISGAKNAALKHMCASLLTNGPLQLNNCPTGLADVETLSALLSHMGATVTKPEDTTLIIKADTITSCVAPYDLVRKMRASVLVLGPLLARFGQAEVSLPGGCAIGTRPIDMHLDALEKMGTATVAIW